MTREEFDKYAIENDLVVWSKEMSERAIKALEQEPKTDTLDKIKAEMKELIDWHDCPIELDNGNDAWYCEAVNRCIAIIDKYRREG